jgi:hypothetical protein
MPGKHHDRLAMARRRSDAGTPCAARTAHGRQARGYTIRRRRFIAAAGAAGLLALTRPAGARTDAQTRYLIAITQRLAPGIEALTERAMPRDWQLLHGCLYYALAGQYLLARYGIGTELKGGTVVYFPTSPLHHRIKPHVWLETASHYIDCSALPRWGYIVVLPLRQVAHDQALIMPGLTEVLILEERDDPEFADYVAEHRGRFERILEGREPDRD